MGHADHTDQGLAFLSGGSVADLVRGFDWSLTGLGPISDWPVEIKSVVAMMLHSPLPMVALFGEVGTMIYNDAYSGFAGARHPRLLGSEVRKGWPEVAEFNDHVIKTVFRSGQTLSFKDQLLTLDRGAGPRRVWLDLDYSPVMAIDGTRLGVIAVVFETTDRVMAAQKLQNERVRLRQIYEQSTSFMALLEEPAHRFVMANDAYRKLVGHREVVGKTVAEALPEFLEQGVVALLDQVFASGVAHRSNAAAYNVQTVPGGPVVQRFIDFVYQPITDADGAVTGIFIDGIDVTDRVAAQAAIAASEARFRTFAQVMPNHVWTAQPDGALDWLNDGVSAYSGKSRDDLLGSGWVGLIHPEDRAGAAARWTEALAKSEPYETEFRIRNAAGDYLWHVVRAHPIRDSAGGILQWIGTNTDIHAQKLSEAETIRDRDRLWTMSQDLMLVCDYQGVITAVNPSGHRMLGWAECEMLGKAVMQFMHPDDAAKAAAEIARVAGGSRTLAFENRFLCKDGSLRTLDWTAVPDQGRIHGVGRDVTEYRRLARDRERIWNISPVVKVVLKLNGVISDANPSWTKVLGWTPDDTIGHSILEFLAPGDRDRAERQLGALETLTGMISTESLYRTKDDSVRRIAWSILQDSGTIYGFGRDVTAEYQAAEALEISQTTLRQSQKMEAIGQLTGGIAHDFNNLLQVIGGNLQLLTKEVAGNPKGQDRIQSALEAVSGGARLASQLLAFGRRQPLAPKVVNLGRLVRTMDEILRRTLGDGVQIETSVEDGLWNTLVDPGNVENALLNLAINGRDAMEGQGNLTIEVGNARLDEAYARTAFDLTPGEYVVLSVTDTGMGIAAHLLEKVFEPFFTTKPEGRGTGLGLSMVYGFVKQSGGHVKIYSEVGQGTTIKMYLPRSVDSEDRIVLRDNSPIIGGTETILVAEDDARVRENVIETLTDLGYRVLQAHDAQTALAIIESGIEIDLLFTDAVMPGRLKSRDLARLAVERMPKLKVLFTSGYTENSIVHGGRLNPGVELLSKPYAREALARKVRMLLSGRKGRGALTVVLCEDDALIRLATVGMLEDLGHTVIATDTAAAALAVLATQSAEVLMTDIGLPDMPGTQLVTQARLLRPELAVIFATGHSEVEGFAPDQLTEIVLKPYDSGKIAGALEKIRPKT